MCLPHIMVEEDDEYDSFYAFSFAALTLVSVFMLFNLNFSIFDAYSILFWIVKTISVCSISGIVVLISVKLFRVFKKYLRTLRGGVRSQQDHQEYSWIPLAVFVPFASIASIGFIWMGSSFEKEFHAFKISCMIAFMPVLFAVVRLYESLMRAALATKGTFESERFSIWLAPVVIYWVVWLVLLSIYSSYYPDDTISYGTCSWVVYSFMADCLCAEVLVVLNLGIMEWMIEPAPFLVNFLSYFNFFKSRNEADEYELPESV